MPWSFFFRPARIWIGLRRALAILALAFAFGPMLAFSASDPGSNGHLWWSGGYSGNSAVAACTAYVAVAYPGMVIDGYNSSSGFCNGHWLSDPNQCGGMCNVGVWQDNSCIAGYVLQPDGSCKSNTPLPPNCSDPSLANKYRGAGYTTSSTQAGAPDYICIKGCQYDPGGVTVTYPNPRSVTGYTSGGRAGSSSGQSCDLASWPQITIDVDMSNATDVSKLPPSPEHCAAQGKFFGQVNGADVCSPAVPGGTTTSTSNSSSSTNDAPASSPGASSTNDTSTKTTCTDTTCTTTTVVAIGGGGGGGNSGGGASGAAASTCQSGQGASAVAGTCTTTTTTSRGDFCQKNPKAPQCEQDSASGGADCGSPPSCSGDAISCAILQQQWNTRCELQKGGDSASTLGQQIQAGNDPMAGQLPTPGKAEQVDMSSKFSNVDDMGFVAQCLPDIDLALPLPGGTSNLHISTAPLCDIGKLLGYLNMLSTLMLCAYMLKGSF